MAFELYTNAATTTLNGAIDSSTTTVVVTSATTFPASGLFTILIDSELFKVTAVSGNTFTVATRPQEGTAAASHSNGATVTHVISKRSLDQVRADDTQRGTAANRPSASQEGRLYLPSDSPVGYRDTGAAWNAFGTVFPLTPPAFADFAWINQGSATEVDGNWGIYMTDTNAGGDQIRILKKSVPATPYSVIVGCKPIFSFNASVPFAGLVLRESGSGKLVFFGSQWRVAGTVSGTFMSIFNYTSPTAFSATVLFDFYAFLGDILWLKVTIDSTNRTYYLSSDGFNYIQVSQVGATNFLTVDEAGFCVNPASATAVGNTILHFSIA